MIPEQRRIALYGKGGIGKTSTASNLALLFARAGHRTLLVGCDPKADSSHLLVRMGSIRPALPEVMATAPGDVQKLRALVAQGRGGVDCIEAGGPEPGQGCAGTGISMTLKAFDYIPGFFAGYDTVLYDVLGDVVCGGFAVPLRAGRTRETYIVVSGDVASIYAANNVARAVRNNRQSGARLAGLIANRVPPESSISIGVVEAFARRIGTRLAGIIPADGAVMTAARHGTTVTEEFPDSPSALALAALLQTVLATTDAQRVVPAPLENDDLFRFLADHGAYGPVEPRP